MQKFLLWVLLPLCLAGCVDALIYHPDIQQGNIMTKKMVDQLRPGLSKAQVRFLMGPPILETAFNSDRWDYVYYFQAGDKSIPPVEKRITLFFQYDQLVRITGSTYPAPPGNTKIPLPLIDDTEYS
jgi:outer membrane protein assembly factor BamE